MITEKLAEPATARGPQYHWKVAFKRRAAAVTRWLHIYLSMVSFAILFFFAVTGLTLNHTEWFAHQQKTVQTKGKMERTWVKGADPKVVSKLEIVEWLRSTHGIKGALGDFRVDDGQCSVSFKGPGYTADVFIERETGAYDLTETRMGLAAVLNDLHKGRDSGKAWSALIDASAIFMTLVSASGLVLLWFVQRRRLSGYLVAAAGGLLCYLAYTVWVP